MGLIGAWLGSLHQATPLVLMSPLAFLARPARWLRAIHRFRGTHLGRPELRVRAAAPARPRRGAAQARPVVLAGGLQRRRAGQRRTVERFCTRFAAAGFRREAMTPVYGLAENSVGLAFPPLGRGPVIDRIDRELLGRSGRAVRSDAEESRTISLVACGRPLPGHDIRIVDAAGFELPERREGRLQFRGPSATRGYWRNDAATRRLLDGDWRETGDLAYVAGDDVYITARTKDLIIRGGRNIHPADIEAAVGGLPGLLPGRVAAFGDAECGQWQRAADRHRGDPQARRRPAGHPARGDQRAGRRAGRRAAGRGGAGTAEHHSAHLQRQDPQAGEPRRLARRPHRRRRAAGLADAVQAGARHRHRPQPPGPAHSARGAVRRLVLAGPGAAGAANVAGSPAAAAAGLAVACDPWRVAAAVPRHRDAAAGPRPRLPRRAARRAGGEPRQLPRRPGAGGGAAAPGRLRRQGGAAPGPGSTASAAAAARHLLRRALRPQAGPRRLPADRRGGARKGARRCSSPKAPSAARLGCCRSAWAPSPARSRRRCRWSRWCCAAPGRSCRPARWLPRHGARRGHHRPAGRPDAMPTAGPPSLRDRVRDICGIAHPMRASPAIPPPPALRRRCNCSDAP